MIEQKQQKQKDALIPRGGIEFPEFAIRHRQPDETFADLEERLLEAESVAFAYFEQATHRPRRKYQQRIVAARTGDSPRLLSAANRTLFSQTKEQAELFDQSVDEILRIGCLSPRTKLLWASFSATAMSEAA